MSGIGGAVRPGIVHRIDKDTSGLLVVAKDDAAHQGLAEQMAVHAIYRVYHAVVYGNLKEDAARWKSPSPRPPRPQKDGSHRPAQPLCLHPLAGAGAVRQFTYIACRLETGRTHQIRVHMASLGHPLAGDPVYGPRSVIKSLNGQCLHAKELALSTRHGAVHAV